MISPVRPKHLKRGSRLAVISPASMPKPEAVEAGMSALRAWGYEPVLFPHALDRGPIYYAGTIEARVSDLHTAFADETIDGVIATRGGWGTAELLPYLDAKLVRDHAKPYIGYSDHTSLHSWFWNECGMQTFYAPMVASDWAHEDGIDTRSWRALIEGRRDPGAWELGAGDGMRTLRTGRAKGRLLGGCLSILAEALGTPWALRFDEPCILFLEDVGTKPYQWDRMLQHLRFAGAMEFVTGVVLGDMTANVGPEEMEQLEAACLHALRGFVGPISIGLRCGHVSVTNRSILLGAQVELLCDSEPLLKFVGDY